MRRTSASACHEPPRVLPGSNPALLRTAPLIPKFGGISGRKRITRVSYGFVKKLSERQGSGSTTAKPCRMARQIRVERAPAIAWLWQMTVGSRPDSQPEQLGALQLTLRLAHSHVVTSVLKPRLERGELEVLSLSGHRFPARRWRISRMSNRSRPEKASARPVEQYITSA